MKTFFNTYFKFSKGEILGILALLILIMLSWLLPFFYRQLFPNTSQLVFTQSEMDSLALSHETPSYQDFETNKKDYSQESSYDKTDLYDKKEKYFSEKTYSFHLQNFDPNSASEEQLKEIGFPDYIVRNIIKFRTVGGKFYKKEDFRKIYGMNDRIYEKIENYIQLPQYERKEYTQKNHEYKNESKPTATAGPKPIKSIDINTSDTTVWASLPLIGSKLANRIVKYRNSLGGFYKKEQVQEVYGISDSTWQVIAPRLVIAEGGITKISINEADLNTLKKHPYIKNFAKNIVNYRTQHGIFENLDDLLKIKTIDNESFQKFKPYLKL